jgi:hypothetical protein
VLLSVRFASQSNSDKGVAKAKRRRATKMRHFCCITCWMTSGFFFLTVLIILLRSPQDRSEELADLHESVAERMLLSPCDRQVAVGGFTVHVDGALF